MTPDQIIAALSTIEPLPVAALHAAVPQAETLAPAIYKQHAAFCSGIKLLPPDENALFLGLHVLAAARHGELWPKLVELARVPDEEIDDFFLFHASTSLTAMMLGVWDGDTPKLLSLIEHADLSESGRLALIELLARLTFDGRIPRATTTEFLTRFESDSLADPDAMVWWGWVNSASMLGLTELEPALHRVLQKPICELFDDDNLDTPLDVMRAAAAAPQDSSRFDKVGNKPIDDPVTALDWIKKSEQAMQRLFDADGIDLKDLEGLDLNIDDVDDDPAAVVRLTLDEQLWLAGFLTSRQAPPTTMSLATLDGFLTALAIGPRSIDPLHYVFEIWGGKDTPEPEWASEEQRLYVTKLIGRSISAIQSRTASNAPHVPMGMDVMGQEEAAYEWADGFLYAVEMHEAAWAPLFNDKRASEDGLAILGLSEDDTEYLGRELTSAEHDKLIERLPAILQRIAAFWSGGQVYPRQQPVRVTKIGRNDPCPCGSGQKYKKCCALKPPPVMH